MYMHCACTISLHYIALHLISPGDDEMKVLDRIGSCASFSRPLPRYLSCAAVYKRAEAVLEYWVNRLIYLVASNRIR
jgi:hypothetical protein